MVIRPQVDDFGGHVPVSQLVEEAETCITERVNEHCAILKSAGLPCEERVLLGKRGKNILPVQYSTVR